MAALSADANILHKDVTEIQEMPMAASITIYKGALVMINAAGYAANATPTASTQFAGVALEQATNGSTVGAVKIKVALNGRHLLTTSGMAQADVGTVMYAADSGSVGATATNAQKVGPIKEFVSATQVWVDIADGTKNPALGA